MATQYSLYFYKGTTFPVVIESNDFPTYITTKSIELIHRNLKDGASEASQIIVYKKQLDDIERTLFEVQEAFPDTCPEDHLKEVCKRLKKGSDFLNAMWCININALLVLKAIKNDDNNGIMKINTANPEIFRKLCE